MSESVVTDSAGNVKSRHDYVPFGEEVPGGQYGRSSPFGAYDGVRQRFTGQERDAENTPSLDFFNARYMASVLGRFASPDPANAGADLTNPQSWNAYGYALNNPLAFIDPSGMDAFGSGGGDDPCDDDPFCGFPPLPIGLPLPEPPPPPVTVEQPNPGANAGPVPNSDNGVYAPGSWPNGEVAGLPPGMNVPGPWGSGLNLPCDFGDCGTGIGPLDVLEGHHIFPQEFRLWFAQHGIDIDAFILSLERGMHRLKPSGIHTRLGGNWNAVWRRWIVEHPNASPQEIMNQACKMLRDLGIGGADTLPDIFIMVNPCMIKASLPFCNGAPTPGTPPTT